MLQINPNLNYSPGEPRLNFPEPTQAKHPKNTGLRPFTSVNAAISKIPPGHPNHELPPDFKVPRKKYDGNAPLRNIVMTAGTSDTHPSGLRPFSLRELACLQGFPLDHGFPTWANRTEIRKQIGNAFPPIMAAVLFKSVKRQLLVRDELMPKCRTCS